VTHPQVFIRWWREVQPRSTGYTCRLKSTSASFGFLPDQQDLTDMSISNLLFNNSLVCKSILIMILLALMSTGLFFSFQTDKNLVVEKLEATAELCANALRDPLHQGELAQVEKELSAFAAKFSLDAVELYSSDGNVLAVNGWSDNEPQSSLMLGENLSMGWPFLLMVQYSHIIFHQERPLAFLILYRAMSATVITALVIIILVLLLCFRSQLQMVFPKSFFGNRHNRVKEAENVLPYDEAGFEKLVRQRTAEVERQRDRALASSRAKGEYLANVSHEIRTSMNGVVGVLSLLQKSNIGGEKRRLLSVASRSADSLLLIINDILDFSKIEAGHITFENIVFDLREVVEESLALYIDTAFSKKIGLHCYIPLDLRTKLVGDPTRLRQIITNLLSNAIKFTENGEISCRVAEIGKEGGEQQLRFSVEDTGIGIVPEEIDNIFKMFTQAQPDTARKYGGTGLGLNICKNLVELQNGEIGVESKPGQGASFWFTLGFERAEQQDAEGCLCDEIVGKNIVVFENCETCCTIISRYVPKSSVTGFSCKDGSDVLHQLGRMKEESNIPDLLLVGYFLIADGLDFFMRGILDLYGEAAPDLYVLTRQGGIGERLKRKGVAGIIYQPIRLLQLYGEICGKRQVAERLIEMPVERLQGEVLLVDDEQINLHVGKMILERIGFDVQIANDGHEALAKTSEKQYDLVLMDVQMPLLSGIEATEMIRRRERERGDFAQTIVAMTANTLPAVRERCLGAGMNGFITKPIKPDMLIQHLRPILLLRREERSAAAETLRTAEQRSGQVPLDIAIEEELLVWNHRLALEYVGGDSELLADLSKLFLQKKDALLDALEDAVKNLDRDQIGCAAHAFKGAVNHFAAEKCQHLALAIERRAEEGRLDGIEADLEELKEAAVILVEELEERI
jgi:two-component system, sensor histidine kinase and response regulator